MDFMLNTTYSFEKSATAIINYHDHSPPIHKPEK